MMAVTHAVISSGLSSLILGKTDTLTLGLSILGSQLPDLDTSTSIIGQICFPISSYLEDNYPHRTVTHCFLFSIGLFLIAIAVGYFYFNDWSKLIALPLGHLISCFSDTFTKQGVQLFYPVKVWCISVSNPNKRLRTGSVSEYWILVIFTLILFFSFKISNNGSINKVVALKLGLREELVKIYNESANNHLMSARITGYLKSDRSKITAERFTVLGEENREFIVMNETNNIYKTGENIIVEKITINDGQMLTRNIDTFKFNDEKLSNKLDKYLNNKLTIINGEVIIDYPEILEYEDSINEYKYINISGKRIVFSYCPLDRALELLNNQYILGNLQIIYYEE